MNQLKQHITTTNFLSGITKLWKAEESLVDWWIVLIIATLLSFSVASMSSISISIATKYDVTSYHFLMKHFINIGIAIFVGWVCFNFSSNFWNNRSGYVLLSALFLLILVLIFGIQRNNAVRWISVFGLANFQPSEWLKFAIIVFLSSYISRRIVYAYQNINVLLKLSLPYLIAVLLLYVESDYSTIILIMAVSFAIIIVSGVPFKYICYTLIPSILAIIVLVVTNANRLERIKAFVNPAANQLDKGYQAMWAEIALKKGNMFGFGTGKSVAKLYLPDSHTDYILAIFAEEYGFVFVTLVLLLFVLLFFRICRVATRAFLNNKVFEYLLCMGVALWISIQTAINLAVNFVLIPTTGVTLPFFSYGGSSLLVLMIAIAVVLRVDFNNRTGHP